MFGNWLNSVLPIHSCLSMDRIYSNWTLVFVKVIFLYKLFWYINLFAVGRLTLHLGQISLFIITAKHICMYSTLGFLWLNLREKIFVKFYKKLWFRCQSSVYIDQEDQHTLSKFGEQWNAFHFAFSGPLLPT